MRKAKVVEKDALIETLENSIIELNGTIIDQDMLKSSLDKVVASMKHADNVIML